MSVAHAPDAVACWVLVCWCCCANSLDWGEASAAEEEEEPPNSMLLRPWPMVEPTATPLNLSQHQSSHIGYCRWKAEEAENGLRLITPNMSISASSSLHFHLHIKANLRSCASHLTEQSGSLAGSSLGLSLGRMRSLRRRGSGGSGCRTSRRSGRVSGSAGWRGRWAARGGSSTLARHVDLFGKFGREVVCGEAGVVEMCN
jgi:hypothetical protein